MITRRQSGAAASRSDDPRRGRPGGFGQLGWPLAGALAALAALVTFDPRLYINGDNVSYMFLARDVLNGELWPSSKFPPLFPWLLAPVQWIVGSWRSISPGASPAESLIAQKLLVLAFYGGAVALLMRVLRRRVPGPAGPGVLLVAATLVPVVEYSHYVMSEIPYLFFLVGAVDAADRISGRSPESSATPIEKQGRRPRPGRAFVGALRSWVSWELALWVAAGFYIRSAGVAAGLGIGIALLLRGRIASSLAFAVAFGVLILPWAMHSWSTAGGNPYFEQFILVNPYYPEFGRLDAGGFLERIAHNARAYFENYVPASVLPVPYRSTYSPPLWQKTPVPWGLAVPIVALILVGLVRRIRRSDPAAWVALVSLVLVLSWPPIWAANRFLIPLAPFLFWLLWEGLRLDFAWGGARIWSRVRGVILIGFVLFGLLSLRNYHAETREYDSVWKNYFATLDWVRQNTAPDAHIIDRKPGFVEFCTGRTAATFPREADLDRMVEFFRSSGADFVLISRLPYDDIGRYLVPVINQRKQHFEVVFQIRDPETDPRFNGNAYVLRFLDEPRVSP